MLLTNEVPRPRVHLRLVGSEEPSVTPRDPDTDVMLDGARVLLTTMLVDPVPCLEAATLCRHRRCVTAAIRLDAHTALDALDLSADEIFAWLDRRDEQF